MKNEKITLENKLKLPHLVSLVLLTLVAIFIYLMRNNNNLDQQVFVEEGTCNLFSGKWVYDNISYPLYKEERCSFMEDDFACGKYGRKEFKYQNWRWQPHDCDLPRFNGTTLLEKLRGKKLAYVGDSLNRNQWKSMLCLIDSSLPPSSKKKVKETENMYYFHSIEYNATIEFYWAPLLVESNCDDIKKHRVWPRVIHIKSIGNAARKWAEADILVFDSFAWWMGPRNITISWGSIESPGEVLNRVSEKLIPYEISLRTWSNFVEMHINRIKTKLFFMSPTAYRYGSTFWGTYHGCYNVTEPIFDEKLWSTAMSPNMMRIIEGTLKDLEQKGVKVEYVNITELSAYREDGHPSIHRTFWNTVNGEQLKNTSNFADCLHWCLPGVPDIWNEILYTYIMRS